MDDPSKNINLPKNNQLLDPKRSKHSELQPLESLLSRVTADFNAAADCNTVFQALRRELNSLGYKYFSVWEEKDGYLHWHYKYSELPAKFINSILEEGSNFFQTDRLQIRVPLNSINIYTNCYQQQTQLSTQQISDLMDCLSIGNKPYSDLPDHLKRVGGALVDSLKICNHNAFPLGKFGLVFFSDSDSNGSEKHGDWIQVVLQQATISLERIRSNQEIESANVRYQALFDRTNDAIFIVGLDLVLLAVNQQAADMLGYAVDELVGLPNKEIIAPEEWGDTLSRQKTLDNGEIPPLYKRTFVRKNGERIRAEISVALVYDNQGNPSHYQSIARNISEKEKILQQLDLQSAALEAAANGIVITDQNGTILWVNQAVTNLTKYSKEDLIGNNTSIFKANSQDDAFYQDMWQTINSGRVWHGELVNKRADDSLYTEEMTITPVKAVDGKITHYVAIKQDITERVQAKELLEYLATHDTLTNLVSRSMFFQHVDYAITRAKRNQHLLAILFIDMDNFKAVNDSFGHHIGDTVLKTTADRLVASVRESDIVARYGGDEFTILLENISEPKIAARIAEQILAAITQPFLALDQSINISASIGISICPTDSQEAEALLNQADQAMYVIKESGKNSFQFYSQNQT